MRRMDFWCDGSATRPTGDRRRCYIGCGIVGLCEGEEVEWSIPLDRGTDGQAELLAVIKSLGKALDRPNTHVVVHSDSQYAIDMITGGKVARSNSWLVEAAKKLAAECGRFEMVKVKAHSGDLLNDRADSLAKKGARAAIPLGKNGIPEV